MVAFASGAPALLGPLDVITDRTRVDVLANGELRLCQYRTSRFLTVKGPARIIVSADGVSVEAGKAVDVSRETCVLGRSISASGWPGGAECQLQKVAARDLHNAAQRAQLRLVLIF